MPLGATEQHGPHLPLDTDTIVAVAWAEAVAARVPGSLVAPPLPYGSSGEHQGFAGTLSIGADALRTVVVELTRSAAATFAAVVYLCGHGGNTVPLDSAVTQLRREGHRVAALVPSWGERFAPVDAHAGRIETSLMLHLAPGAVAVDRAAPGVTAPLSELLDALVTRGMAAVTANGVLGDPGGATADLGRRLLADLTDRSVAEIRRLLDAAGGRHDTGPTGSRPSPGAV